MILNQRTANSLTKEDKAKETKKKKKTKTKTKKRTKFMRIFT